ncbi:hypothetical protein BHE74_00007309 [Ensete ventricosum]|nr:hypothetical protein BHE74_00007309 [Ensete ventricosum]RZR89950.1 hypothetical protein BHM03_00017753 [Ensete ventricosum]
MDSSSLKASGALSSASDALHGLKFGQKIYFDDGGGGSGSSSKAPTAPAQEAAAPPPPTKKGKGVAQAGQQQPPRCQVEGCNVDLTGVKAYYCRHKVCGMHSKAPKVVVAGLEQRFCQQFHQLPEFDQGKRSCRRRLAGHNERRRKPPPGPFASRYGRLASSVHGQKHLDTAASTLSCRYPFKHAAFGCHANMVCFTEDPSRFRSFLMDFTYPYLSSTARNLWPTARAGDRVASNEWHVAFDTPPGAAAMHGTHACFQGPPAATFCSPMEFPPGECLGGVSDSSCALSLLSTHPWSSNSARNRAPVIAPSSSTFDGPPMAQSAIPGNYGTSSWGLRGHGIRTNSSHEIQHATGATEASDAHFLGQVELALQENGQCLDHGSARAYAHSSLGMHWSL